MKDEEKPKINIRIIYRPFQKWTRRYEWKVYKPNGSWAYYEGAAPFFWLAKRIANFAGYFLKNRVILEKKNYSTIYRKEIDVK